MSVHFHQYENATLTDKRLSGTTRTLYDFMLAHAHLHTNDFCMTIRELAEGISRVASTVHFHLNRLITLGFITRTLQKDPHNPKWNQESRFTVHKIAKENPEVNDEFSYRENSRKSVPPPTENQYPIIREDSKRGYLESNSKREAKTPLKVEREKKEPDPKRKRKAIELAVQNVPDVIRPVAEYLLHKTGKFHFTAHELDVLRSFVDTHTPLRVMKEIDKCCERFIRKGKNLRQLTFNYIGACLKNQHSLVRRQKPRVKNATETHVEAPVTQCETQPSVIIPESELSLTEAEKIIATSEPAKQESQQEALPAENEALLERIKALADEKSKRYDEYLATLPRDEEYGGYIFPENDTYKEDPCGLTIEEYLRLKYPEAEDEELHRDYYGTYESYEEFREAHEIEEAAQIDFTCAVCEDPERCYLSERYQKGTTRPIVQLKADSNGQKYVHVGYSGCVKCRYGCAKKTPSDPEYERRLKSSGLTESQYERTFEAYKHGGALPEIVVAKAKAIRAAENESNLILSGKAGTGKTHLAIAIAIEAMKHKRGALFRSVPELLDELRERAKNHDDFFQLMHRCKNVSCLVLDDLGKQKTTEAGMDYLYQIIDYRYRNRKQTIITTNAFSIDELENRFNEGKIEPLLSRILENGDCAVIRSAVNYRYAQQLDELFEEDENEYRLYGETGTPCREYEESEEAEK